MLKSLTVWMFLLPNIVFSQSVTITWNPNSEDDLAGYRVFMGEASRGYTENVDVGNQTRYVWSNLIPGKKYFFAVTAYDLSGNESDYSDEASIVIGDIDEPIDDNDALISNVYNFPNPFEDNTNIHCFLNIEQTISIIIYDSNQEEILTLVDNQSFLQGEHLIEWDSYDENRSRVQRGVYYCKVTNGHSTVIIKMAVK